MPICSDGLPVQRTPDETFLRLVFRPTAASSTSSGSPPRHRDESREWASSPDAISLWQHRSDIKTHVKTHCEQDQASIPDTRAAPWQA